MRSRPRRRRSVRRRRRCGRAARRPARVGITAQWPAHLGIAALLIAAGACGSPPPRPVPLDVRFTLDENAFDAPEAPQNVVPFDVVSGDMEGDGDTDLLINWHNEARLELFDNRGGRFVLANPEGADHSGLYENRGIADLYAPVDEALARARAAGPGVYVWHEPARRGEWHFWVAPDGAPVRLTVRANRALTPRLDERFVRRRDELDAELVIDEPLHFRVGVAFVATELVVDASLPLFVGAALDEVGRHAELWKDDPHGIAWVDVLGTPPPDIFISRGGLMGELLPPLDAKVDRFFEYTGSDPLYADRRDRIPPNYGRGRRVEWVDVDGDGVNELYVGNTATPNELLVRDEGGNYVDVAPAAGLDFVAGDTFAWLDCDGDGRDDLVAVDESGFVIAYNRGDRAFEVARGETVGLRFPAGSEPVQQELFTNLSLHVLDADSDGRLDLWLAGHGEQRRQALYRGTAAGGFEDVTAAAGLAAAPAANNVAFIDVDNDGDEDVFTVGIGATWLYNDGSGRFTAEPADATWDTQVFTRAVAVDADGDGRLDLALFDHRRLLARNETVGGGGALRVLPRAASGDPVGAVVTAFYAGGRMRAQRYGSAAATQYSQGSGALHFGIPPGDAIARLEIRWPDGGTAERAVAQGEEFIEWRR